MREGSLVAVSGTLHDMIDPSNVEGCEDGAER